MMQFAYMTVGFKELNLIDLHCHLLPGIDDGAADLTQSIEMARAFVADGVSVVACTPHILPGLYHNSGPQITQAVANLQQELDREGIALQLISGADNHVIPDFVAGLQSGHLLPLGNTRYVLVEPPHHSVPARLEDLFFEILVAGYIPILTHPERLNWITSHYEVFQRLAAAGVWMQITAGSLTGSFGRGPRHWCKKMLSDGIVHIISTDAHDMIRRPPILGQGRAAAAELIGDDEAEYMVVTRPQGVLENVSPTDLPIPQPIEFDFEKSGFGGRGHRKSAPHSDGNGLAGRLRRHFFN